MKSLRLVIQFQIFCLMLCLSLNAQVKDTHKIIEEWVETKLIISEESSKWESEKAALSDLQNALTQKSSNSTRASKPFRKRKRPLKKKEPSLPLARRKQKKEPRNFLEGMENLGRRNRLHHENSSCPLRDKLIPFVKKSKNRNFLYAKKSKLQFQFSSPSISSTAR